MVIRRWTSRLPTQRTVQGVLRTTAGKRSGATDSAFTPYPREGSGALFWSQSAECMRRIGSVLVDTYNVPPSSTIEHLSSLLQVCPPPLDDPFLSFFRPPSLHFLDTDTTGTMFVNTKVVVLSLALALSSVAAVPQQLSSVPSVPTGTPPSCPLPFYTVACIPPTY